MGRSRRPSYFYWTAEPVGNPFEREVPGASFLSEARQIVRVIRPPLVSRGRSEWPVRRALDQRLVQFDVIDVSIVVHVTYIIFLNLCQPSAYDEVVSLVGG